MIMSNKLFAAAVVVLWLVTMSWLVTTKILPPMNSGEPPTLQAAVLGEIACWKILWNDEAIGWAGREVAGGIRGAREIHARVVIDDFRLSDFTPSIMAGLVEDVGPLQMDAVSRVDIDPLGDLSGIEAKLRFNGMPAAITMTGRVRQGRLEVRAKAGTYTHETQLLIPNHAGLGNELTPTGRMPAMYVGRSWKMYIYSPFRLPSDAVEIVQAEVVREEFARIGERRVPAKRIEYRRLDATGVSDDQTLKAIAWVTRDGTVVRQQVFLFNGSLVFERLGDEASLARARRLLAEERSGQVARRANHLRARREAAGTTRPEPIRTSDDVDDSL